MGCGGSKDGPTSTAAAGPALAALKDLTSGSPNCTPIPEADAAAALKILNLSGCKLGPEGGAALRDALPSMAGLEILALSDTTLGLEGVKNLSDGLKSKAPPNLTKLLLRNSFEDDAGCIAVCGALTKGKAKALQTLDLGGTGLSNEGVSALIKMCATSDCRHCYRMDCMAPRRGIGRVCARAVCSSDLCPCPTHDAIRPP